MVALTVYFKVFTLQFILKSALCGKVELPFDFKEQSNSWQPIGNGSDSWSHQTGTGIPPSFGTCTGTKDKYLLTNRFDVQGANWITASITMEMQDCTAFDKDKCSLFTKLYYFLTSTSTIQSAVRISDFVFLKNIGNKTVLPDPTNLAPGESSHVSFNHTVSVNMNGYSSIYFAFQDNFLCGSIFDFKVSYLTCPALSDKLIEFAKNQPTPSIDVGSIEVPGACVVNSQRIPQSPNPGMVCYTNGTATVSGECQCNIGYENSSTQCLECLSGHFKTVSGNIPCTGCGANSFSEAGDRSVCLCQSDYFRRADSPQSFELPCEKPPSKPLNLIVTNVTSSSAILRWDAPNEQGTGDAPQYTIRCDNACSVSFEDHPYTNITLQLGSYTVYNISVTSVNNVTRVIDFIGNKDVVSFRTSEGVPGIVRNMKVRLDNDGLGVVTWTKPVNEGGVSLRYLVMFNTESAEVKETQYIIKRPSKTTTYTIRVYALTDFGRGPPSASESLKVFGSSGVSAEVTIGIAVSLTALLVIVIIIAIILYKRRHPKHLQSIRYENGEVKLPNRSSGAKIYIDPTTYQDLTEAVTELAKELDPSWIILEKIIGGGEFGDVYKATLERPGQEIYPIAVKTLKHGAARQARDDFLAEAAIMGQFDDPNVIFLEGVVLKERPIMIVTEFMSNGSLDTFLKNNDSKFVSLQLLGMARGVTSGMMYLAELSFIHRDLAARNILVDENLVCKVADFGMSRELKMEDDTYDTKGGKIPVRWTAPEAIQFKKFTTASDVWSFGILLWEIMSYGEKPYWDWGNYEVLERVSTGYRLPPPMGCPKVVHDLMLSAWNKDRVKRPKFRDIRERIDKWIRNPELLQEEASVITKRDDNLDYTSMKTINEWLGAFKMSQYTTCFTSNGYSTPRQIFSLNDEDLKRIGIQALGHRNLIMRKINTTKGQLGDHSPNRGKSIRI